MSQTTPKTKNREIAISHIAYVLGIPVANVTDDLNLGYCAHYVASLIYFTTGCTITFLDFGTVTVKDVLEQL